MRHPRSSLEAQEGSDVSLGDFAGRTLLVYFYPKADTPDAPRSCAVRDTREDLRAIGVDVVGISPDEPGPQAAFDQKFGVGFPLLSDPDHAVADAWGTWGEKSIYGNSYMGIVRSSFLVDLDGRIQEAWYKVSPKATVPNALKALGR